MQHRSQIGATENIELKDTWFTPDIEENTCKTPTHVPRVAPLNNKNMVASLQPVQQVQESPFIKRV